MYETPSDFESASHYRHNQTSENFKDSVADQQHNANDSSNGNVNGHNGHEKKASNVCCRTGRPYELSCSILSLSFLEQEEDIYTLDDLKERY
ncbi:hypothetical protein CYPRO_1903 [Cyclonatronum proteinivorum]|uniref:Uncharacterized protein n=1 Tax=Cyclonatronum proteinivorum TaxID=1457365 RepID=A0A345UL01_9BACT|nr:hypothetical protein [Cyclonatronum proteinivorum]AXJ01153.1 hypothetical protein CYPRO_1903 [Cyclonatronum proteinivorum]